MFCYVFTEACMMLHMLRGHEFEGCWVEGMLTFACTYLCHSGMRVDVVEEVSQQVLEDLGKQNARNESFKTGVCRILIAFV